MILAERKEDFLYPVNIERLTHPDFEVSTNYLVPSV